MLVSKVKRWNGAKNYFILLIPPTDLRRVIRGRSAMFLKAPGRRGEYKYIEMVTIHIKGRIYNIRQNEEVHSVKIKVHSGNTVYCI